MQKPKMMIQQNDFDAAIGFLARYTHDPVGFVHAAFDWDNDPTLQGMAPQSWQVAVLADVASGLKNLNTAVREVVASGNGIGKSALVAWLILWGITTYPDARAVVTANTDTQLKSKTWAELQKWFHKFILRDFFECTATALYVREQSHQKTWRADAVPWSRENPEAFAGLHNNGKRIILIFDEGSAIPDIIWETAEGAMTDKNTEIIWCAFGNPTRNTGRFYECFHHFRNIWNCRQIDSRTVSISNKQQLSDWIDSYGPDSDFVRIHILGEFPNASEYQFISREIVMAATKRDITHAAVQYAPGIIGVDPAWTGTDKLAIVYRRGLYSKILGRYQKNDDDWRIANIIAQFEEQYSVSCVNVDFGLGTGIVSAGKSMGKNWNLVYFSGKPTDNSYMNKRAEIWGKMKKWLMDGGAIEHDRELIDDLIGPEYTINDTGKLQLESKQSMKKRGVASPNVADALALTFANEITLTPIKQTSYQTEYDPFNNL